MEYITLQTVLIVGAVCALVVLTLTIVLIVLCCKRCRAKSLYEKERNARSQASEPLNHHDIERQENGIIPIVVDKRIPYTLNNKYISHYNNDDLISHHPNGETPQCKNYGHSLPHHSSYLSINHPQKRIIYEVVV